MTVESIMSEFIQIRVKPGSSVSSLEQGDDGAWTAKVKSQPVDGKANKELIALVAQVFGCRKANVQIRSGSSGRTKLVRIDPD